MWRQAETIARALSLGFFWKHTTRDFSLPRELPSQLKAQNRRRVPLLLSLSTSNIYHCHGKLS